MKWNRSLPNGTKDKLFKEAMQSYHLESIVNHHFEHRGYQRIETPLIEFEEVFEGMEQKATSRYRFFDEQGRIVVLRPDMTLPVGRVVSTTGIIPPVQLFYSGKIFRVIKGHSGDYSEQLQAGMELIGYESLKAETECLINAVSISQKCGIADFQIELGHAAIVESIVVELGLSNEEQQVFAQILQSKNTPNLLAFLKKYETHKLYPFVSQLSRLFGDWEILAQARQLTNQPAILDAISEMEALIAQIHQVYPEQAITVDLGLVRELKYYSGMTFKGYTDQSAGSFFSGGRYDQLLTEFSVAPVPAVGLVFYLDKIYSIINRQTGWENPVATKTLIHFEEDCLQAAEALIASEAASRLSLHQNLEDSLQYAKQWQIPQVVHVQASGVKFYQVEDVTNE